MASNNEIRIRITVNDAEASRRLQQFGSKLKEMGERVNFIGSRFTAMFTAPVVGGLFALAKAGSTAAAEVNALQKQLTEAIKEGNQEKIAELNAEMEKIPDTVRRSARAWNEFQIALQPANDALTEAKTTLLEALVPLVKDLAPALTDAANAVKDLTEWFSGLPKGVQKGIVGIIGLGAALGPVMLIVGQFMGMIGSAAQLLGAVGVGVGTGGGAAVGGGGLVAGLAAAGKAVVGLGAALTRIVPIIGVFVGALMIADRIVKDSIGSWEEAFKRAATAARQLLVIGNYLIGGKQAALNTYNAFGMGNKAGGGPTLPGRSYMVGENGPEMLLQGAGGGYVVPSGKGSRGGGAIINLTYAPTISTASEDDIERLVPTLRRALRMAGNA